MKHARNKLGPYRLLVMLMYGKYEFVDGGTLRTGPMARLLRIPNSRVKEYMEFLYLRGFLSAITTQHGSISYKICKPTGCAIEPMTQSSNVECING